MRFIKQYLILITTLLLFVSVAQAQQPVDTLEIVGIDPSGFPTIGVSFVARDVNGVGIEVIEGLQLVENELSLTEFSQVSVPVGVDLTFVIDANRTIAGIDLIGDLSRLEKVKSAIDIMSQQYVSRAGLDRVSVLAPVDGAPTWLIQDASDPDQVTATVAEYLPSELPTAAPVDAMLRMAFQQSVDREPTNRYQAIVLLSDAEFLRDQVDFFAVRDISAQTDAVFFGLVLGKIASQDEIDNMAELFIPTGGTWGHMPQPEDADPIFRIIKSNSEQRMLRYRSTVSSTGVQSVRLADGEVFSEATYDVVISPPQIEWLMPNQPLVRDADSAETERIETQINWTDGFPRELDSVRFFVNDIEQRIDPPPVLDSTGLLTFDWNIANLAADVYRLEIELTDELGGSARSGPFLQKLEIEGAVDEPAEGEEAAVDSAETEPTTEEAAIVEGESAEPANETLAVITPYLTERNMLLGLGGLIGLLGLIFALRLRRRGDKAFRAEKKAPGVLIMPENVYIELLAARDAVASRIPVASASTRIGSDPFRADIVLDDDSVSRYHAKLNFEGGSYVLYDEGSAFGTRVNFEPIGLTPRPIQDGDELTFGSVRTRFRIYGSGEGARLPKLSMEDREKRRFSLVPEEPQPVKAVIFDLDGTLIDSESVAMVAWKATVAHFGAAFDERHQSLIIGIRLEEALESVIDFFSLPISAETLFDKLAQEWRKATEGGLPVMPGVYELIDAIEARGIPWGVATNSERDYAHYHLDAVQLLQRVKAVVGSDDVAKGKPAPDVFLECARLLEVDPINCLAVEDTAVGHFAAAAAGMTVIVIPNDWSDQTEFSEADRIYNSLSELTEELGLLIEGVG